MARVSKHASEQIILVFLTGCKAPRRQGTTVSSHRSSGSSLTGLSLVKKILSREGSRDEEEVMELEEGEKDDDDDED